MLTYILEVTLCWTIFYFIFFALLRKVTFYRVNRWYLLSALLFGIAIPLLRFIEVDVYQRDVAEIAPLIYVIKDAPALLAVSVIEQTTDWTNIIYYILSGIYFLGLSCFLFRFIKGLYTIRQLYISGDRIKQLSHTLITTQEQHLPFSFLNNIFISSTLQLKEDIHDILKHELAHVNSKHSLDVLLVEIINIIFWFHPLVYLYKTAIRQTHEYLADAVVLQDTPRQLYGKILLKQSLSGIQLALAHHFFHSHIKKRITMMYSKKSGQSAWLKYSLALPVLMILFIVFSGYQKSPEFNTNDLLYFMEVGCGDDTRTWSGFPIAFTNDKSEVICHNCPTYEMPPKLRTLLENFTSEKAPLILIDRVIVSPHDKRISNLKDGFYAEEITIHTPEYAQSKYGEKAKNGAIELLRPKSIKDFKKNKRLIDISKYDLDKGRLIVRAVNKVLQENTHYYIDYQSGFLTVTDNNLLAQVQSIVVTYVEDKQSSSNDYLHEVHSSLYSIQIGQLQNNKVEIFYHSDKKETVDLIISPKAGIQNTIQTISKSKGEHIVFNLDINDIPKTGFVISLYPKWFGGGMDSPVYRVDQNKLVSDQLAKDQWKKGSDLMFQPKDSFSGDEELKPLIVIDGNVQLENFDVNSIDPSDIETMNILKGEVAIDKYDNRGLQGVIEIISTNPLKGTLINGNSGPIKISKSQTESTIQLTDDKGNKVIGQAKNIVISDKQIPEIRNAINIQSKLITFEYSNL